jgi:hypothetical protein
LGQAVDRQCHDRSEKNGSAASGLTVVASLAPGTQGCPLPGR